VRIAFSSLACPKWSVEETAEAAKRLGYDGIEWRLADGELLGPRTGRRTWERIASCGVPAVCLDTSAIFVQPDDHMRGKAIRHTERMAERAKQIGAQCVRVFAGAIPDGFDREDVIGPTRAALAEAAGSAVTVLVETHDAWSLGADVARLTVGVRGVGVLWDVAHTLRNGESPDETLMNIGIPGLVHVKDAIGDKLTLLGEGELDIRDALAKLPDDITITFEWEKLWHSYIDEPEIALPHAIAYLRNLT
jgi:sugar phosphate isomerase/epimerase